MNLLLIWEKNLEAKPELTDTEAKNLAIIKAKIKELEIGTNNPPK